MHSGAEVVALRQEEIRTRFSQKQRASVPEMVRVEK